MLSGIAFRFMPMGSISLTFCRQMHLKKLLSLRHTTNKIPDQNVHMPHCPALCLLHTTTQVLASWSHGNPIDDLNSLVSGSTPVIVEEDCVFSPSKIEIKEAQTIFRPIKGQKLSAEKGVVDLRKLPPAQLPEVCFVGKSNVGKSSLIKALFYDTTDIRVSVSKKAGHTRSLKFYSVRRKFSLVDMPGYGFNMPEYYVDSVEQYLKTRSTLAQTFLLIDTAAGITSTDDIGIEMVEEMGRPYTLVLTKIDKCSRHKVLRRVMDIKSYKDKKMSMCFPQLFLVSSQSGAGLELLRTFIGYVTGNVRISHNTTDC